MTRLGAVVLAALMVLGCSAPDATRHRPPNRPAPTYGAGQLAVRPVAEGLTVLAARRVLMRGPGSYHPQRLVGPRLFVSVGGSGDGRGTRLSLAGVGLLDLRTGDFRRAPTGPPRATQVWTSTASHGWIAWTENPGIDPFNVRWTLHVWDTRTGRHRVLGRSRDIVAGSTSVVGDVALAIWRRRVWLAAPCRDRRTSCVYAIGMAGRGGFRLMGRGERTPATGPDGLYTVSSSRTGPARVLRRVDPGSRPDVVADRVSRDTTLLASRDAVAWTDSHGGVTTLDDPRGGLMQIRDRVGYWQPAGADVLVSVDPDGVNDQLILRRDPATASKLTTDRADIGYADGRWVAWQPYAGPGNGWRPTITVAEKEW